MGVMLRREFQEALIATGAKATVDRNLHQDNLHQDPAYLHIRFAHIRLALDQ
jgi:hypothetical protein